MKKATIAFAVVALIARVSVTSTALAQSSTRSLEKFGALVRPIDAERPRMALHVVVQNSSEFEVVAKVLVQGSDKLIVMLPDSQLMSVNTSEAESIKDRFIPASMAALGKDLTHGEFRGFKTRQTNHFLYVTDLLRARSMKTSTGQFGLLSTGWHVADSEPGPPRLEG